MANGCTDVPTCHSHNEPTDGAGGNAPILDAADSRPLANQDASNAIFMVVMGVSGTGKSTLGVALSKALHLPFIDGDDLHPQSNVAKMSCGEPLTDADRQPWLETIRKVAVAHVLSQPGSVGGEARKSGIVIACSSLKEAYRSILRGETLSEEEPKHSRNLRTYFVYMKGSREVLMDRMTQRQGHFMKAAMLDSQLNTLENPENEEGVVTVSIGWSTEDQVRHVVKALRVETDVEGSV